MTPKQFEKEFEELTSDLSDKEKEGMSGLFQFLAAFDNSYEILAKLTEGKLNYCPHCGGDL